MLADTGLFSCALTFKSYHEDDHRGRAWRGLDGADCCGELRHSSPESCSWLRDYSTDRFAGPLATIAFADRSPPPTEFPHASQADSICDRHRPGSLKGRPTCAPAENVAGAGKRGKIGAWVLVRGRAYSGSLHGGGPIPLFADGFPGPAADLPRSTHQGSATQSVRPLG